MVKALEFILKLNSIPVVLTEVDGTKSNCVLSEFDGERKDEWFEFVQSRMNISKIVGEGEEDDEDVDVKKVKVEIKEGRDVKGMEATLISLCLYGPDGKLLAKDRIQKFPSRILSSLFKEAQKLNGLSDPDKVKAEAKKE